MMQSSERIFVSARRQIHGSNYGYDETDILYKCGTRLAYKLTGDLKAGMGSNPRLGWRLQRFPPGVTAAFWSREDALRFIGLDPDTDDVPLFHTRLKAGEAPVILPDFRHV